MIALLVAATLLPASGVGPMLLVAPGVAATVPAATTPGVTGSSATTPAATTPGVTASSATTPAEAQPAVSTVLPAEFPEPESLAPNVRFWERVYGEWTSGQVIFHDRAHLGVIFAVVDLGELRLYPLPDTRAERARRAKARREIIDRHEAEVRGALERLAALAKGPEPVDPNRLTDVERRVWDALASADRTGDMDPARLRWQYGLADQFELGLSRYDRWRGILEPVFLENDVPTDVLALGFVESLFDPGAYSHAGASGLFQLMPATGRELGLSVDRYWDERRDPLRAADAASRMLRRNYQRLGNWPLALTGYNHGPNGVARGVEAVGSRDLVDLISGYTSPSWGFASTNFYAEFLAARNVLRDRGRWFGDYVPAPPVSLMTTRLPSAVSFPVLARAACVDPKRLEAMNPALLPPVRSGARPLPRGWALRLPGDTDLAAFHACAGAAAIDDAPSEALLATSRDYRVRQGDTLGGIARRFRVPVAALVRANGLSPDGFILSGQVLRIPGREPGAHGSGPVGLAHPEP